MLVVLSAYGRGRQEKEMWTYAGTMPITAPQPNRVPQQLNRARSSRYARRLTLVRILASASVSPGGSAFLFFFVVLTPSLVAGTVSKYGSCKTR